MVLGFLGIGSNNRPLGVKWRSSVWFVTLVVFLSVFVDLLVYSIIIPIIPFRLEHLGHTNPAALAGWLLFAYSFGLIVATPPIAFMAERYWSRRTPLILALLALIGSQVIFMEANVYWLMCVARVLQGISSAAVWVVSFSLLCDTVPEKRLGQQLGIVMSGISLGFLIGPPIGGLLNEKLGYRSAFVTTIAVTFLDMVGRLLVVEKNVARPWLEESMSPEDAASQTEVEDPEQPRSHLSVFKVLSTLCRSKRASMALVNVFVYGVVFTMIEPTLPLRLQELYGYTSLKVGIIFLAAVIPSLFSAPLAGWISDQIGVEWVTVSALILCLPWWIVMAIRGPVALLVASLAIGDFFLAAVTSPLTAELAAASKVMPGIGYAHVFGAFNFAYSCASAVGPVIGGQLYTHVKNGWTVIMGTSSGFMVLALFAAFYGVGEVSLYTRLTRRLSKTRRDDSESVRNNDLEENQATQEKQGEQGGQTPQEGQEKQGAQETQETQEKNSVPGVEATA